MEEGRGDGPADEGEEIGEGDSGDDAGGDDADEPAAGDEGGAAEGFGQARADDKSADGRDELQQTAVDGHATP